MYPDKYTKQFWLEHIEENLKAHRTEFLDRDELGILKKLAEQVLAKSLHKNLGVECDTALSVLEYVDKLNRNANDVVLMYIFAYLLALFQLEEELDGIDKKIVVAIKLRIIGYIEGLFSESKFNGVPLLSEGNGSGLSGINDEDRIAVMKDYVKGFRSSSDKADSVYRASPPQVRIFVDNMKNAYHEGRKILQYKANGRLLNELMRMTADDEEHNEYSATGYHNGNIHRNSSITKGFIKDNGIKSVRPVYDGGNDIVFHSHPDIAPLSLNGFEAGDLGHAYKGKKKVFVINSRGEIFYTNPALSGNCFELFGSKCDTKYGQVYLGDIKEFVK